MVLFWYCDMSSEFMRMLKGIFRFLAGKIIALELAHSLMAYFIIFLAFAQNCLLATEFLLSSGKVFVQTDGDAYPDLSIA